MKVTRGSRPLIIQSGRVTWGLALWPRAWWWAWWTPVWHEGRGPYLSIGLYVIAVYRGY